MPPKSQVWRKELAKRLLPENKAQEAIYRFIENSWPTFEAPTNADAWRIESKRLRDAALDRVFLRGFPLAIVNARPKIVWGQTLRPDPSFIIRKLRYEIFPDYWIPALLYEPAKLKGKAPVVLNPNGHHIGGKAVTYKQIRCANLSRRGVIALNMEFIGMCELEADRYHNQIAHLNLTGLAGVGMFYLALKKGLDILLSHKNTDTSRCGVTGLSGGGWQTIIISALDPRVNLIAPAAGYTSVRARVRCTDDIGDLEQVPPDQCSVADYQELTAMLAPKPLLQIMNAKDDCCFRTDRAKPIIYDALRPVYRAFGAEDKIQYHSNVDPGTHNYGPDNRSRFYRFINEQWGLNTPDHDVHADADIFREEELNVGLPPNQKTLMEIALDRARHLTRRLKTPRTTTERRALRRRLEEVIRLPQYRITSSFKPPRGNAARSGVLTIGPWKVPVSVRHRGGRNHAQLIISEQGRAKSGMARAAHGPGAVAAADILGAGENATDFQRLMLIDTAGHRVIGVQTAQILALAEWLNARGEITLITEGWACTLAGLLAAALRPQRFRELHIPGDSFPASLVRLIDRGERYETMVPMFCFGLLETADIPQLKALLENVRCVELRRESPQ